MLKWKASRWSSPCSLQRLSCGASFGWLPGSNQGVLPDKRPHASHFATWPLLRFKVLPGNARVGTATTSLSPDESLKSRPLSLPLPVRFVAVPRPPLGRPCGAPRPAPLPFGAPFGDMASRMCFQERSASRASPRGVRERGSRRQPKAELTKRLSHPRLVCSFLSCASRMCVLDCVAFQRCRRNMRASNAQDHVSTRSSSKVAG